MFRFFVACALALGISSSAFAMDKSYYQIKKVIVKDITAQYQQLKGQQLQVAENALGEVCGDAQSPFNSHNKSINVNPIDQIGVYVDQIINIGKKIWSVVEAGRPTVNMKLDTANALPRGMNCWTDMAGWSMPQAKVYSIQYVNYLDLAVVDFTYRVIYTPHGNVNGVGQYITNAGFIPTQVSVAWGFKFDVTASIPSVINQGTKEAPVAGMQMNINWIMDSVVTHEEMTRSYFVTGENAFVELN
jgi:hypothetical protein